MVVVTPAAAEQILRAAAQSGMDEALIRVAARFDQADGSVEYGMGFDERREQDAEVECEGVTVLVSPPSREALEGTVIDFVEYQPGDFRFIFSREPAPQPAKAGGGCGSCSCGKGSCS